MAILAPPISATVTPNLAAKYSHQVSALLTAYRLLDFELLYNSPGHPITFPPVYPNSITLEMVEKPRVKERWRKLDNWQKLLVEFRDCYNGATPGEDITPISEPSLCGSLAHLQGLAESHTKQKFTSLIQNFRGAALHWTFLHETAQLNAQKLPAIPENVSAMVDQQTFCHLNEKLEPHTRKKVSNYLQDHSQGELVLPMHLSLMITPCFLLMPATLVKSKFPRQSIYQVSVQSTHLIPVPQIVL